MALLLGGLKIHSYLKISVLKYTDSISDRSLSLVKE